MYVWITKTGQLLELQRRLRSAGNENLRRSMQRRIRSAAEPFRDDVKQRIRTNPIRGNGRGLQGTPVSQPRPFRETIANAVRISVVTKGGGAGAKVWVDRSLLPADMKTMAKNLDSGRWRHLVFGVDKTWTTSYSKPFWQPALSKNAPKMRKRVERILDDVKSRLD